MVGSPAILAVQASTMMVLFHPLTLKVSHAVAVILLPNKISLLSPSRHLSCITVLLLQPHVGVKRCVTLNPSTLLPTAQNGEPHDCMSEITVLPKPATEFAVVTETEVF